MDQDNDWHKVEAVVAKTGMFADGPIREQGRVLIKVKEHKKSVEVEAKGVAPDKISAAVEKEYLVIRHKKEGLGLLLPGKGKVLKKVFLTERSRLKKIQQDPKAQSIKIELLKRSAAKDK
ncbi:hypothetical protein ACFL5G_02705 [Candidatus Margulisiibacteriota bacterium]